MEAALAQAIDRLETVLTQEMKALESGRRSGLAEFGSRKNQSLLELTRLSRGLSSTTLGEGTRQRLEALKIRLAENQRALKLHMEATSEISDLILSSLKKADSDGTYAASKGGIHYI